MPLVHWSPARARWSRPGSRRDKCDKWHVETHDEWGGGGSRSYQPLRLVALWGCCVYLTATMMRLAFSALLPALAAAQVCVSDISGDGEVRRTRPRSLRLRPCYPPALRVLPRRRRPLARDPQRINPRPHARDLSSTRRQAGVLTCFSSFLVCRLAWTVSWLDRE